MPSMWRLFSQLYHVDHDLVRGDDLNDGLGQDSENHTICMWFEAVSAKHE